MKKLKKLELEALHVVSALPVDHLIKKLWSDNYGLYLPYLI